MIVVSGYYSGSARQPPNRKSFFFQGGGSAIPSSASDFLAFSYSPPASIAVPAMLRVPQRHPLRVHRPTFARIYGTARPARSVLEDTNLNNKAP